MRTKLNWNAAAGRISVVDGSSFYFLSDDSLPDEFSMRELAEAFASTYDHNSVGGELVATIEDGEDGEVHKFAFDREGNFDWDTNSKYISY